LLGGRKYPDLDTPVIIRVWCDSFIKFLEVEIDVALKIMAFGVGRAEERALKGTVHRVGRGLLIERDEVRKKRGRMMH